MNKKVAAYMCLVFRGGEKKETLPPPLPPPNTQSSRAFFSTGAPSAASAERFSAFRATTRVVASLADGDERTGGAVLQPAYRLIDPVIDSARVDTTSRV